MYVWVFQAILLCYAWARAENPTTTQDSSHRLQGPSCVSGDRKIGWGICLGPRSNCPPPSPTSAFSGCFLAFLNLVTGWEGGGKGPRQGWGAPYKMPRLGILELSTADCRARG